MIVLFILAYIILGIVSIFLLGCLFFIVVGLWQHFTIPYSKGFIFVVLCWLWPVFVIIMIQDYLKARKEKK